VVALEWSPCGRLLAGGHGASPGFTVWDVASGEPSTISAGESPAPQTLNPGFHSLLQNHSLLPNANPEGNTLLCNPGRGGGTKTL